MIETTTPGSVAPSRVTGTAARVATALLAALFLTIIVGQIAHTRQFWLLGVFLGLFLLSRRDMKWPFFALAFALPLLQVGMKHETYMIAPTLEVCVLAFFVLWFIRAAQGKASLLEEGLIDPSVLLFLLLATGSAMAATSARVWTEGTSAAELGLDTIVFRTPPLAPLFPVRQLFIFLEAFLLFGFVRANLERDDVETLALSLLGSSLLVMLFGALVFVKFDRSEHFHGMNRATAMFTGPNQFGTYLLMLLPMAVALARTARHWLARGLAIVAAGGGAVMLFLSHSEGAWLGGLVAPVLYVFFFRPAVTRRVRMGRLLIAGVLLGVACLGGFLLATLPPVKLNDHSDGRYYLFRAALNMLRHSPLVGVGLGNFYQDLGGFYPDGISGRETHEQAHNMYLQLLTELGPLGLASFALPFVTLLSRAARTPDMTPMARALLIGVLAVLLHSVTDYTLWIATISLMFWMYLGALAVLLDASSEHPRHAPTASGP